MMPTKCYILIIVFIKMTNLINFTIHNDLVLIANISMK